MLKRLFDIVFSFIGIVVLSPLMFIISILCALSGGGGIFFLQERIGRNGQVFKLIKFRTMRPGSEKKGLLTIGKKDDRVTAVGYVFRRTKLDELPQLFNVLAGSMSLVGPRPEVKKYVDLYNDEQKKVLTVRPGITDFASIEYFQESELLGKSDNPEQTYIEQIMPDKLNLNLKYIEKNNLGVDIGIIFKTLIRVLH